MMGTHWPVVSIAFAMLNVLLVILKMTLGEDNGVYDMLFSSVSCKCVL